ncbi:hypothetical protein LguiB_006383 [Lonicera macranthoides]
MKGQDERRWKISPASLSLKEHLTPKKTLTLSFSLSPSPGPPEDPEPPSDPSEKITSIWKEWFHKKSPTTQPLSLSKAPTRTNAKYWSLYLPSNQNLLERQFAIREGILKFRDLRASTLIDKIDSNVAYEFKINVVLFESLGRRLYTLDKEVLAFKEFLAAELKPLKEVSDTEDQRNQTRVQSPTRPISCILQEMEYFVNDVEKNSSFTKYSISTAYVISGELEIEL